MENLLSNVYYFNPTCDFAVANGNMNWQPNRILQKMEADLSALQMFFAKKNDFVVVDHIPSENFISEIKKIINEIPEFVLKNEVFNNSNFIQHQKNKLLPWGWSPAAHRFLSPLKPFCSVEFQQSPVFNWSEGQKEISSRKFSLDILKQVKNEISSDILIPREFLPEICRSKRDIDAAIQKWGKIMIKAPWSSSGRGLQPITKIPVHQKVWEKVLAIINEQGFALAEPYLNKILDVALLFEIAKGKVEFLGISNFYTNNKGQYEGNWLNGLPGKTEKQVVEFKDTVISEIRIPLMQAIETSKMIKYYEGFFGIDMLIYTDDKNNLKINPCLEINVRQTMGLLALNLEKLIYSKGKGIFSIYFQPGKSFLTFKTEMEKKYPLQIIENKIKSGFLALTEAHENTLFGAFLLVN